MSAPRSVTEPTAVSRSSLFLVAVGVIVNFAVKVHSRAQRHRRPILIAVRVIGLVPSLILYIGLLGRGRPLPAHDPDIHGNRRLGSLRCRYTGHRGRRDAAPPLT
jgi:hypothetical protein